MFKSSQAAMWVVTAGALVTAGLAVTVTQLISTASSGSTGTASSTGSAPGQIKKSDGPSDPPSKSLALNGALNVSGLAPGVSIPRTLTIGNPNNQDVELQSVRSALSSPSPTPTIGSCTSPADIQVIVDGYDVTTGIGTPVTIRKNSSVSVPVTVRMNNRDANQDACKAKSWTFTFTATATSK